MVKRRKVDALNGIRNAIAGTESGAAKSKLRMLDAIRDALTGSEGAKSESTIEALDAIATAVSEGGGGGLLPDENTYGLVDTQYDATNKYGIDYLRVLMPGTDNPPIFAYQHSGYCIQYVGINGAGYHVQLHVRRQNDNQVFKIVDSSDSSQMDTSLYAIRKMGSGIYEIDFPVFPKTKNINQNWLISSE